MDTRRLPPHRASRPRRRIWRAWAGVGSAFAVWWTGAAERAHPARFLPRIGYEAVELRRTGENHLFLFAKVNGRQRSCLVDTGWSLATVSTNTAARLSPPRIITQLNLGSVSLTNEAVAVQDLRVNGRPAPYDVVLGCDFLIRHHALVDCANHRLYLRRRAPSRLEQDEFERQLRQAGWTAMELQLHHPLAWTCEVQINGSSVAWLVDSGAMWSCLDAKVARSLNLRLTPSPNRIRGPGAPGEKPLAVADLRQFQIGDRELPRLSVAVFSLSDWGLGADGKVLENVGGILGGSELAALGALLDCRESRLWLRAKD